MSTPAEHEVVVHLSTTPVKGTRMHQPRSVVIDEHGIVGDRRFLLVGANDDIIAGARTSPFLQLMYTWDRERDELTLRTPDGDTITGPAVGSGRLVNVEQHGIRTLRAREVPGPWADLLSDHAGHPVRLLRIDDDQQGFDVLPITLVSEASLEKVGAMAGGATVEARRLRGALVLGGLAAHAEEEWEDRVLAIGEVRLLVRTPVPRCVVTALDPDTGDRNVNVPRAVASYRRSVGIPDDMLPGYQGPPLAVYAEVLTGGTIELGMPFRLEEAVVRRRRDRPSASAGPVGLRLLIANRSAGADGVVVLELVDPEGRELPTWEPGAHVELHLENGLVRQYSLCGDPSDRSVWRIGVLRVPDSRGGSAHVHESLLPGTQVRVRGPRNNFALAPSRRYIFIAGGIGITPILPMTRAAELAAAEWELHYGGRSRLSMAFLSELADGAHGTVVVHPEDEVGLINLKAILGEPRPDTLVYCCGPEPLLKAVEQQCAGWPPGSLHLERFAAKALPTPIRDEPFEVELAASGVVVTVAPEQTIIDAAADAGVTILASCLEGICGTCETKVLGGEVDHRDSLLTPEERAANDCMYPCVSRSAGPKLVLDV